MKKKWILLLIAAILVLVLLIKAGSMVAEFCDTSSSQKQQVTLEIKEGSTLKQVGKQLKQAGLINSEFVFRQKAKQMGYADSLRFGVFDLDKGWCLRDIIETLATQGARKDSFSFLVPEGYSVEQICKKAVENGICTKQEFYWEAENGTFDYEFLSCIPNDLPYNNRLQGFLFPTTYSFDEDTTAHSMIDTMLAEFDKHYQNLKNIPANRSFYEIITIASLIERETALEQEAPRIAGVIYNRLEEEMPLQIDAAIVYACSDGLYDMTEVLYDDLEVDSPYNTYQNPGIPVGPICNPGITAIKAAFLPEKHSYLYYHTDEGKQDGSHIFTKTFEEHSDTMNYESEAEQQDDETIED